MQKELKKYYSLLALMLIILMLSNFMLKAGISIFSTSQNVIVEKTQEKKTNSDKSEKDKSKSSTSTNYIYQITQKAVIPLANFDLASVFKVIFIFDFPTEAYQFLYFDTPPFISPYFSNVFTNIIAINAP